MTYNKKVMNELMEDGRNEDIKEKSQEIEEGRFETWLEENKSELQEVYSIDNKQDFEEYAKMRWREEIE